MYKFKPPVSVDRLKDDFVMIASYLDRILKQAGLQIDGVSIGDPHDKSTWRVHPRALQGVAQPYIDAFDPANPIHATTALQEQSFASSRDKNRLAMFAVIVRGRNVTVWDESTPQERMILTLKEASIWKNMREMIN